MTGQPPSPDLGKLAVRASEYPGYRIWSETIRDRTRYIARSRDLTIHPYVLITDNLDEIWTELAAARRPRQP